MVGLYQPLLVLRAGLDRTSGHGVDHYVVRHFVALAVSLYEVEDILVLDGIEAQHVLAHPFHRLFERSHLFLIAQHPYDVVAGHYPQLGI